MRKIKFRAWHKNMKSICYNVTTDLLNRDYLEFMQYTNLDDKNGIEIYEGDILKVWNTIVKEYEVGKVVMSRLGMWSIVLSNLEVPISEFIDNRLSLVHDMSRIEVIGNIYENEELLNQKEMK